MRILSVAAYLSDDGSYGGPVSVALDQADALQAAGHEVTLAAGWDGVAQPRSTVRLRLFRARKPLRQSFAGLVAPGLPAWVLRHAREFDVVHVHVTRDLVTLPAAEAARRRGVPVVLQTHGQIRPQASRVQRILDVLLTRRLFRGAGAFLALTPHEEDDLRALLVDDARVHRIDNGVPAAGASATPPGTAPLVLYSSRLAGRKRPGAFVAAAEIVHRARPDARFELWGPDGGELAAVQADIAARQLTGVCEYRGAASVDQARAHLADASVFVLPSVAEPFPMALLEAFSAGLPAVITDRTGLSPVARETGAACVTDGSPQQLAEQILRLLDEPGFWKETAAAARELAAQRFAMPRIAERLVEVYRTALDARP